MLTGFSEALHDKVTSFVKLMRIRTPGGTPNWFWFGLVTTLGILIGLYPNVESRTMPINVFIVLMAAAAISVITLTVLFFQIRLGDRTNPGYRWKIVFIVLSLYTLVPLFVGMLIGMPIGQFIA